MNIDLIAKVCHDLNRMWCATNNDFSQTSWADAPDWQKDSARTGVRLVMDNPDVGHSALHDSWMAEKLVDGWRYGPVKDPVAKTHPCLVDFSELPTVQQFKDVLFLTAVRSMIGAI